ncbi:MAG: ABC transporter permease [Flammeovirgaceae bacterium]|nr:ABC transporter permease [Flammeovirgaceae bacterium]
MIDEDLQETVEINNNIVDHVWLSWLFSGSNDWHWNDYTCVFKHHKKNERDWGSEVLGASILNIAGVINFEFAINLMIATVIGGIAGYLMADFLMDSIWEYYLKVSIGSLTVSILALIFVAIASVGYKTISTASLNPTKTLRDE